MAQGADGDEAEGLVPPRRCPGSSRASLTFSQMEAGPSPPQPRTRACEELGAPSPAGSRATAGPAPVVSPVTPAHWIDSPRVLPGKPAPVHWSSQSPEHSGRDALGPLGGSVLQFCLHPWEPAEGLGSLMSTARTPAALASAPLHPRVGACSDVRLCGVQSPLPLGTESSLTRTPPPAKPSLCCTDVDPPGQDSGSSPPSRRGCTGPACGGCGGPKACSGLAVPGLS